MVVVDADNRPVGALTRHAFLAALAGPNSYALWAPRPALRLAAPPQTLTGAGSLLDAAALVSRRDRGHLADDIIVVDELGRVTGAIAVHEILRLLVEEQVATAREASPLTGLPGNAAIDAELTARIAAGAVFAVTYLDLDRFKDVNDRAGFAVGDRIIVALASGIVESARSTSAFVGHIGGDDFLVVADNAEIEAIIADALAAYRRHATAVAERHAAAGGVIEAVTVSAATVFVNPGVTTTPADVAAVLAPVKRRAKQLAGTAHVLAEAG